MKPSELLEVLPKFFEARQNTLITGAPGGGKTSIVKQACANAGFKCRIWHPVVMQPIDIKGMPWVYQETVGKQTHQRASFLPFEELRELMETKEPMVCFADDIGHATPAVQAAFMQLLLAREIDGKPISDTVVFSAATNRKEDKAGVMGILEPVKSRFCAIIQLDQDVEDWTNYAASHGFHDAVLAYVNFKKDVLHSFKPTSELTNSPSARTLEHLSHIMNMGFNNEGTKNRRQLQELATGAIGKSEAADFMAFLDVGRELPDPQFVLEHPHDVKIPKHEGAIFILVISMARIVDKKTVAGFVDFVERVPPEFRVLGMTTAKNLNETIATTDAYRRWTLANKDIILGREH